MEDNFPKSDEKMDDLIKTLKKYQSHSVERLSENDRFKIRSQLIKTCGLDR